MRGIKTAILSSIVLATSSDGFTTNFPRTSTFSTKSITTNNERSALSLELVGGNELLDAISSSLITISNSEVAETTSTSTFSKASYYTTLALYAASFPGLWSTIKRSTVAKVKRKTFTSVGENALVSGSEGGGKSMKQQAAEIMAYMKANNYEVADAGSVITFRGVVARSASQAFFLTFCTGIGLASLALVLQIQFQELTLPGIGQPNWFLLTLLAPYAGIYYWKSGDRVDEIKVKLTSNDEETQNDIVIEGNDEEIDRMWRALELTEKGMVKIEGIIA